MESIIKSYYSSSVSSCIVPVIATSFSVDLDNVGDKVTEAMVTKKDGEKDGGDDCKSNHTVLFYFAFILLLVLFFSFNFFLPSFFDTFLYYFVISLVHNRFVIRTITNGALANFLSSLPTDY